MKALKLAISFVRIPRLFATLLLLPLILSIAIVYGQLLLTGTFIAVSSHDAGDLEKRFKKVNEHSVVRKLLLGESKRLAPIKICRWSFRDLGDGKGLREYPPDVTCNGDSLDAAIHSSDPAGFDASEYVKIFNGNVERLHICKECRPDIVIAADDKRKRADVYSIQGMMILSMVDFNEHITGQRLQVARTYDKTIGLIGSRYLHSHGFLGPVKFSGISTGIAFICSIAFLIIITLWLALKAHRRVLDYFARNGALLPMVAATGKRNFYNAIWLLTLFRVGAFLLAAVPLTIVALLDFDKKGRLASLFASSELSLPLWIVTLISSMALATMVASIADLKQRHQLLSFVYKYIPLIICFFGAVLWLLSFVVDGTGAALMRNLATALPVIGMVPVLIAPVFQPHNFVLVMHTLMTILLFVALMRHNTRWFAAHLEDL